ncbi:acetylornithine/N-succinyldiaminopimelate aminotransferase [Streptomyces umbrinus]|uniref:Acetylornithine/N-succinyldiaminopimelate aminotransferase n=1 Tax=Streptomyces umbrinus TaxID=67370 RepID=A0ABU0SM71_9ACTN|nr:aminotransferase class I/II-fold pyridoxal phosphate-dependent enzyme [Streptomyces umbrinus]MDQ1024648.1 acetylornithine/N-succinyldiaminopimelate aminotransferase [Streptomyces umbrinus]
MSRNEPWRREEALALAVRGGHEPLDLSLGIPRDPPARVPRPASPAPMPGRPQSDAFLAAPAEYPPSAGTMELREAAARHILRRYRVAVPPEAVAACVGSKEFISTLPLFLRDMRRPNTHGPERDTVLIPALGYPAYEFGARLAGLRAHRVPVDDAFRMRLDLLPARVADRALCLWVNSPANPTGVVEPLGPVADWGRAHGVVVVSDEAYVEATWCHEPRTILCHGLDGVLAVHSMSKRSNSPGLRVGFCLGDPSLVAGLARRRREAGLMAAAASQEAARALLDDDRHAEEQRARNARRVADLVECLNDHQLGCTAPAGGLFAWVPAPGGDGVAFARRAAEQAGLIVRPGCEYGPAGHPYVRFAAVQDSAAVAWRLDLLSRSPVP